MLKLRGSFHSHFLSMVTLSHVAKTFSTDIVFQCPHRKTYQKKWPGNAMVPRCWANFVAVPTWPSSGPSPHLTQFKHEKLLPNIGNLPDRNGRFD
jgi:hypothetical protein